MASAWERAAVYLFTVRRKAEAHLSFQMRRRGQQKRPSEEKVLTAAPGDEKAREGFGRRCAREE